MTLTLGSLFSGYGGLDLGVSSVLGARTAWCSEIDPHASKVLAHRFPDAPNIGDIQGTDWSLVDRVDILTGGFPCQDVSVAGARAGLGPGTRTGLWAEMAAAIDALRPSLVVAENVRGILSAKAHSDVEPCPWCLGDPGTERPLRALGAVLADLADLGYDAQWHCIRASDVGAAHRRERVFIFARPATDTHPFGCERPRAVSHPAGPGVRRGIAECHHTSSLSDPDGLHVQPESEPVPGRGGETEPGGVSCWGPYRPAVERWADVIGRTPPKPTTLGARGNPVLSPAFVEWLMGLPEGHVTGVPGLSRRAQLRMLGNGVVPQQAAAATRRFLDVDNELTSLDLRH